jgi:hypothetical protein
MPRIGLQLPEQLHAELVGAAKRNQRSLHGEIIFRLSPVSPLPYATQNALDHQRAVDREAKPDPKPVKKK